MSFLRGGGGRGHGWRQATSRACSPCLQFLPWYTKALILTRKGPIAWPVWLPSDGGLYLGAAEALRCSPQPPSFSPHPFGHYFHVKARPRHTKPVEMHQRHPPRLPLCVLMVRPGGGGWGLEQVRGAAVPSTCSGPQLPACSVSGPFNPGSIACTLPPSAAFVPAGLVPISHSRSTREMWPGQGGGVGLCRVEACRASCFCTQTSTHPIPSHPFPSSRPLCPGLCLITRNIKIS